MENREENLQELLVEFGLAHKRVEELQAREKKLSQELEASRINEARYRQIVQNANSIIMLMDTRGNIRFLNQFAQRFFGFYEKDVLGLNIVGTIVAKTDLSGNDLTQMIKDITSNPELHSVNENENIRSSGERVRILWTNKAIIDSSGAIKEILCIGNEVAKPSQKR
ncbi:MAG: PAS domain-containing protein [Candidatus Omnitrophota bacterium]|nr:PAS domain-containing protein [Candidatus Omnitrophota bacterium]MDD5518275.1 PAS domain-containing protein [Candidatus Omnitrophota bacterium]